MVWKYIMRIKTNIMCLFLFVVVIYYIILVFMFIFVYMGKIYQKLNNNQVLNLMYN